MSVRDDALARTSGRNPPPISICGNVAAERTRLAHWLHANGARASRPLFIVDCHEPDVSTRIRALFAAAEGATLLFEAVGALDSKGRTALAEAIDDARIDVCVIATARSDEERPLASRLPTLRLATEAAATEARSP